MFTPLVLLWIASAVCHAQAMPPLTTHVRQVTVNGQAPIVGFLPAAAVMRLVLVLPVRNQSALDEFLTALYDPSSPSFHQFLTVDQFTATFGPTQDDYDAVIAFAQNNGLTVAATSRNRINLDVTGSVASIEQAFHLNLGVYQDPTQNRTFYAPDREPSPDLGVQLWHIAGLDNYSVPQPANLHKRLDVTPKATTGSCPSASFCGSDMRAAYYGGSLTGSGQSLGLVSFVGTNLADLNTYFANAGQTNNVPITLVSTDGTSTACLASSGCDDTEQTLDMTQALGMAPGPALGDVRGIDRCGILQCDGNGDPIKRATKLIVVMVSCRPNTDNPYFQEFAAQGQTLFQASGDNGSWSASSRIYPADSIYVTSVGGRADHERRQLERGNNVVAWRWWYLAQPICDTVLANSDGRKLRFLLYHVSQRSRRCSQLRLLILCLCESDNVQRERIRRHKLAAPMWAGFMALANQQAVARGGSTQGFINPSLYAIGRGSSYAGDFHDITSGSNGFPATIGYDLATGWGSQKGAALINAFAGGSSSVTSITSSNNPSAFGSSVTFTATVSGNAPTGTVAFTDSGDSNQRLLSRSARAKRQHRRQHNAVPRVLPRARTASSPRTAATATMSRRAVPPCHRSLREQGRRRLLEWRI